MPSTTGATEPWRFSTAELELVMDQRALTIRTNGASRRLPLEDISVQGRRRTGWRRHAVDLLIRDESDEVGGLRWRHARRLQKVLARTIAVRVEALRVEGLRLELDELLDRVRGWQAAVDEAIPDELRRRGWLGDAFRERWDDRPPQPATPDLLQDPVVTDALRTRTDADRGLVRSWHAGVAARMTEANARWAEQQLHGQRDFFERIERSPLTEEQARAVVCLADRVLVVASAGSGKTSTMVAKAAYAVQNRFVEPQQVLMLAFNRAAAQELGERTRARFEAAGLTSDGVRASTFHALGQRVIGAATGRKPSVAPWVEQEREVEKIDEIVERLRGSDGRFRSTWDLFRFVFGRDLPDFGEEEAEPEDWDRTTRRAGFRTLQGEVVKSRGERMIADWLFYNGVEYEYERPYEIDLADAEHRQYTPDFYYPSIDAYHEHWALDEDGRAPESFKGYEDEMVWKREQHAQAGTTLLETTMAELWSGRAFEYLERELTQRGIVFAPDPDRPVPREREIEQRQLIGTVLSFLKHAKSNRLSDEELKARLRTSGRLRLRHALFLRLFGAIRREWQREMTEGCFVDFEDMLEQAADHLERGHWTSPFELVMVDEFQDASFARARLVRALAASGKARVFAVGDDWQSINRFAGADVSVMTDFEEVFGPATTLRLERTFRSPQALCDLAGNFVQRNPDQLSKTVRSSVPSVEPVARVVSVGHESEYRSVVASWLDRLNEAVQGPRRTTVHILGRYNRMAEVLPPEAARRWPRIDVQFLTVHRSKGLEADYVVIPGLTRRSFPSTVRDDSVLQLAMPNPEEFPFAEERRLLYVALTRARRSVLLLTVSGRESPFLTELVEQGRLTTVDAVGERTAVVRCEACGDGVLVERRGQYGVFLGCSNFPRCRNTTRVGANQRRPVSVGR